MRGAMMGIMRMVMGALLIALLKNNSAVMGATFQKGRPVLNRLLFLCVAMPLPSSMKLVTTAINSMGMAVIPLASRRESM